MPLVISCGDQILERTVANRYRPDVEAAGHGEGRCGFDIIFNPPLSSARLWLIHVRSEIDGAEIPGSPFRLDPATNFDEDTRRSFAAAIADATDAAGIDDRLAWLDSVRDRLMAARAEDMALTADAALARRHGLARRPLVPRALFLDDAPPDPDRDGGSKAALSHMRSLQQLGFEVSFAAPDLTRSGSSPHLAQAGITHLLRPLGNSIEELLRQQQGLYDLVYLHRVSIASCYAAHSLAAGVPCLCSTVAAEGIGLSGELAEALVSDRAAMPEMIVRLYGDPALHLRLAEGGQAHVRRHHAPALVDRLTRQAVGR